MNGVPKFSVVMPAYNAGDYISEALDSLIMQTFMDYEVVVVDDGSSDFTGSIVEVREKIDPRIRLIRMPERWGSAFGPRTKAMRAAKGEYVVCLDADDYIEPDFLEKINQRICQTGADMVYCKMLMIEDGRLVGQIPREGFDSSMIMKGAEAVKLTLREWQIGAGGATMRREFALAVLNKYDSSLRAMNADEIFTRYFLIEAATLAFCDARYFYRMLPTSVTHALTPAYFDRLETNRMLRRLIDDAFGAGSHESDLAALHEYDHWIEYCIDYCRHADVMGCHRADIRRRLETARRNLQFSILRKEVPQLKYRLIRAGLTPFLWAMKLYLWSRGK